MSVLVRLDHLVDRILGAEAEHEAVWLDYVKRLIKEANSIIAKEPSEKVPQNQGVLDRARDYFIKRISNDIIKKEITDDDFSGLKEEDKSLKKLGYSCKVKFSGIFLFYKVLWCTDGFNLDGFKLYMTRGFSTLKRDTTIIVTETMTQEIHTNNILSVKSLLEASMMRV